MAKEKNGRNFHLYENELNSLKKDTEMLVDTPTIEKMIFLSSTVAMYINKCVFVNKLPK